MHIFITGATGYIGGSVAAKLIASGHRVRGLTRTPGETTSLQGSVSTSQARLTVDGPLARGARYLLSMRSGFPALIAPRGDASYVRGGTSDALAKLLWSIHTWCVPSCKLMASSVCPSNARF